VDFVSGVSKPLELPFDFAKIGRLALSACGTAYLAGLISKYWFERYARLPVDIDVASEFRYREMPLSANDALEHRLLKAGLCRVVEYPNLRLRQRDTLPDC
ncbi:SIS domain-containing protein, partial [Mesorhizobium sp. M8A.F.Ca.ET.202.01.1.1]|uniref:SIS domain-containing protein n=1 Tax=Mesorhizobium sp. M8A.F.Ca.ET.202.01.1.1 TaxID=2563967 RepID=UPI001FE08DAE